MAALSDRAINAAWRAATRLGPRGRRAWTTAWAQTAGRLPLRGHRQWGSNVELATGRYPDGAQTRAAAGSWLRNLLESVTLERWTPRQIEDAVLIDDADWRRLRDAFEGPGAVLALGHLGSWDLCGSWACLRGMPVTSVAERLTDVRFERFLDARRALGMRIYPLDEPRILDRLVEDVREGRLVCLLADRDLKHSGVPVVWPTPGGGWPLTVPVGPALVARRSGAALLVVTSHYEGERMRISIGEPVQHVAGRDGLATMMQRVTDELAAAVAEHPSDWHVFGRFFRT